jgi:hypothetical protein
LRTGEPSQPSNSLVLFVPSKSDGAVSPSAPASVASEMNEWRGGLVVVELGGATMAEGAVGALTRAVGRLRFRFSRRLDVPTPGSEEQEHIDDARGGEYYRTRYAQG